VWEQQLQPAGPGPPSPPHARGRWGSQPRVSVDGRLWDTQRRAPLTGVSTLRPLSRNPSQFQRPASPGLSWVPGRVTPMTTLIGYARVSTPEQSAALQQDALVAASCFRVFVDVAGGTKQDRPQLAAALDQLRPGDTLVVWRLDRLGRSLRHLIDTVTDLDARQVGFRSLTESIDTTTTGGRLLFHVFGALAEFERDLIRDRTTAGLEAARARGRVGGRKPALTGDNLRVAQELYAGQQHTVTAIAKLLGVGRSTVYRSVTPCGGASRPPQIPTRPVPHTSCTTATNASRTLDGAAR